MSRQICWLVATVTPKRSAAARSPHGSPAQNPSICPAPKFGAIWLGGTVTMAQSLNGSMPDAASQ